MIPRHVVERIIERVSIVEVISDYVPLKRRGQNYVGLCPFHSEKSPSFTVNEDKRLFYCFGCHAGGDVIGFLAKHDGMGFSDAVRNLGKRYGIEVTEEKKREQSNEAEDIFKVNKAALEFFVTSLKSPLGVPARDYMKERGYEGEPADRFRVGYAPGAGSLLYAHLKARNSNVELAVKIGLLGKDGSRYYDRFRGRIIFPITDSQGRVIGFGGRSMDGKEPKYLNSPESPVFRKASTLYGLYSAKGPIGKEGFAIIVEGYFDLLSLRKAGFANSVATMGTALTLEHLRNIKRYANAAYVLFDNDEAGKKAALRGLGLFMEEGMAAMAVVLPEGKDPDDFLKKRGPAGLKEAISSAEPLMDFFLKELKKRFDVATPRGKTSYLEEALPYIARTKNVAEKDHYAGKLGRILGISMDAVYTALNGFEKEGRVPSEVVGNVIRSSTTKAAESMLLKVLLRNPRLYDKDVLAALGKFKDPVLEAVAVCVSACFKEGVIEPSAIMERASAEGVKDFLAGIFFKEENGFMESPEKMLKDCVGKLLGESKLKWSHYEDKRRGL
ncbi:MAG: DNA primase [Deltaproteobacteria bacterium]